MGVFGNIIDTLDSVYKTAFGKSSIKTAMEFNDRAVARTVANKKALNAYNGFGRTATQEITINKTANTAKRVIKKGEVVRAKNMDELSQLLGKEDSMSKHASDEIKKKYNETIADIGLFTDVKGPGSATLSGDEFQKFIGREGKNGLGAWNTMTGYFNDAEYGSQRMGVTAGAAVGTGIAIRHLQGGNMTTTAQGERNIAGIPFV